MKGKCCAACFDDVVVRRHIEEHGTIGKCDFTAAANTKVVQAATLLGMFTPLLGLYRSGGPAASSLVDCIQVSDGWRVFSERLGANESCSLLDEIRGVAPADSKGSSAGEWAPKRKTSKEDHYRWWNEFSLELKHRRRFVMASATGKDDPRVVLSRHFDKFTYTLQKGKNLYRARIGMPSAGPNPRPGKMRPFPAGKEMGAPPEWKARSGRGNPSGISYLYASDEEATAIAEVRPYLGAKVSVARIEGQSTLRLVDVARNRKVFSPFLEPYLEEILEAFEMLQVLNEQLSRPIAPDDAELDYLPTQYFAEVARDRDFDGIRYQSAVSAGGTNFMVFDQNRTMVLETKLVEIADISIRYKDVTRYR